MDSLDSKKPPSDEVDKDKRAVLRALSKYAAATGASAIVLSADEALAQSTRPCSQVQNPNPGKNCQL
ncbi:MAG: hypothetical protein AAFR71_05800 [Pseudomonadota bacterium]